MIERFCPDLLKYKLCCNPVLGLQLFKSPLGLKTSFLQDVRDPAIELLDEELKDLGFRVESFNLPIKRDDAKTVIVEYDSLVKRYVNRYLSLVNKGAL